MNRLKTFDRKLEINIFRDFKIGIKIRSYTELFKRQCNTSMCH